MGLFGKSETEKVQEQMIEEVGVINSAIRNVLNRIDRDGGVTLDNSDYLSDQMLIIESHRNNLEMLSNTLSPSKLGTINLPWIDGRYTPFAYWSGSFNMFFNTINNEGAKMARLYGLNI